MPYPCGVGTKKPPMSRKQEGRRSRQLEPQTPDIHPSACLLTFVYQSSNFTLPAFLGDALATAEELSQVLLSQTEPLECSSFLGGLHDGPFICTPYRPSWHSRKLKTQNTKWKKKEKKRGV